MSNRLFKNLVIILVLLLPFYIFRFKIGPFRTNIFEISALISFVLFMLERIFAKKIKYIEFGGVLPLVFLAAALLAIFKSENFITGLGIFKGWFLTPYLIYLIAINTFDENSLSLLSAAFYTSLIMVSFLTYLQKVGFLTTVFYQVGDASFNQYLSEGRYFGPFESPNFLAMFIVPVLFLSVPLITKIKDIIIKILVSLLLLLPIYALYLTSSRAGLFAFAVSAFTFIIFMFFPAIKKHTNIISSFKIIGLAIVNILYFYFFLRIKFPSGAGSDHVRQEIYNYSLKVLQTDWLFGIGLGNFQERVAQLPIINNSFRQFGLPYALHPHNLMLAIWLNLGIAGILVFMLLLGQFIKRILTVPAGITKASAGAALTAILIHGLFDTTYFKNDLSALFWIVIAIPLILYSKSSHSNEV